MASRLNKRVLASYSMVALPIGAMAMPIAIYLPPFYSGGLGLSLATVGLIFTLARVWDLITDPVMGVVIDRYGSRWGQYKHWVALAIPLLMLAIYKLFLPNPSDVDALYLGGWLLVLYVGYTMLSISHNSWGSVLAGDYDERSKIFGWREIFIILGMGLVLAIPATLDLSGDTGISEKMAAMGMFCLVLFRSQSSPQFWRFPIRDPSARRLWGSKMHLSFFAQIQSYGDFYSLTSRPPLPCQQPQRSISSLPPTSSSLRPCQPGAAPLFFCWLPRHARVAQVGLSNW